MDEYVVLVNPYHEGEHYIEYAEKLGYQLVIYFNSEKNLILNNGFLTDKLKSIVSNSEYLLLFEMDICKVLSYFTENNLHIKGIIACSEPGVAIASQLAGLMGLICNNPATIEFSRKKDVMRKALAINGLAVPNFAVCNSYKDLEKFLEINTYPCIIKTPEGAGTNHIYLCHNKKEVFKNFNKIVSLPNLFNMRTNYALMESYIEGNEYVINAFVAHNNIFITDIWEYEKINSKHANFLYGSITLREISDEFFINAIHYVKRAIIALNISIGSVHAEIKIDNNGKVVMIEAGARIPGAGMSRLSKEGSNINIYIENIKAFTDTKYIWPVKDVCFTKTCKVLCFHIEKQGVVIKILGVENILALKSYVDHDLNLRIGEIVQPSTDLQSIPFMLLLANSSQKDLEHDIKLAKETFKILIREEM